MAILTLELYYNAEPVENVPEDTEIELRLANRGLTTLAGVELWVGQDKLRSGLSFPPGATLLLPYKVQDVAGQLNFSVRESPGSRTLASTRLEVYPQKISRTELEWLKYQRLPSLLAHLDAPNSLNLSYSEATGEGTFPYTSLDFTAQKLRHFCRRLLDEGLLEAIDQRLDYRVIEKPRREEGMVRGPIRWNPTVQGWLNSPAETGLSHHWVEAPVDYATRPNLLLVCWLRELALENRKLVRQVETTRQASVQLERALPEFRAFADSLKHFLTSRKNLQPALARRDTGYDPRHPAEWAEVALACQDSPNPAYGQLAAAFEEYNHRYIRLPEETAVPAGIPPVSVIYEWWVACEIAAALGLAFNHAEQGRQSGVFQAGSGCLFYNQAAPGGWYSGGRLQPARPDLRLQQPGGTQIFFDVKYRLFPADPRRAHPEDMYRMLAYMNDFDIATGVIIFPGPPAEQPGLRLIEAPGEKGQPPRRIAELTLRPPTTPGPEPVEKWEADLRKILSQL
ncbi:MAG: hypothetical protein JWP00_1241 [Chloroflexi bacterium]|jgi:hypothetical protein|nr:hypothetical protein [Chloroflexota bacterium]